MEKHMRKLTLLAAAAFAATAVPASATISITDQQQVGQGQTIQFPVQPNGTSVIGFTNQTNTSVTFSTLTSQTLTTPSQGQARIEATSGTGQIPLNSLLIALTAPNTTFGYIEFNLFGGGQFTTATSVTIHALDQFGNPFDINHAIGNGENFFSALASNGERITSISFNTSPGGVTDIRQIRINTSENIVPLPEPGTWGMMIFGFGAAGIAMRRSRRRKALLAQMA
jgi:PEP-CTERM motif